MYTYLHTHASRTQRVHNTSPSAHAFAPHAISNCITRKQRNTQMQKRESAIVSDDLWGFSFDVPIEKWEDNFWTWVTSQSRAWVSICGPHFTYNNCRRSVQSINATSIKDLESWRKLGLFSKKGPRFEEYLRNQFTDHFVTSGPPLHFNLRPEFSFETSN